MATKKQAKSERATPTSSAIPPWEFHDHLDKRGINNIENWHNSLSKTGRANLNRTIQHLKNREKKDWSRPQASPVGNNNYVIRFKDETRMQHRVFGHFYDPHNCFVLCLTGYEKDNVYYPENYQQQCKGIQQQCSIAFSDCTEPSCVARKQCNRCTPPAPVPANLSRKNRYL